MKHVDVKIQGQTFTLSVEEPGQAQKARLLAMAPDDVYSLQQQDDVTPKVVDWFVTVAAEQTQLSEHEIHSLSLDDAMRLSSAVVEATFDAERPTNKNISVPTDGWMVVAR